MEDRAMKILLWLKLKLKVRKEKRFYEHYLRKQQGEYLTRIAICIARKRDHISCNTCLEAKEISRLLEKLGIDSFIDNDGCFYMVKFSNYEEKD